MRKKEGMKEFNDGRIHKRKQRIKKEEQSWSGKSGRERTNEETKE